jgi:hypothetical protein
VVKLHEGADRAGETTEQALALIGAGSSSICFGGQCHQAYRPPTPRRRSRGGRDSGDTGNPHHRSRHWLLRSLPGAGPLVSGARGGVRCFMLIVRCQSKRTSRFKPIVCEIGRGYYTNGWSPEKSLGLHERCHVESGQSQVGGYGNPCRLLGRELRVAAPFRDAEVAGGMAEAARGPQQVPGIRETISPIRFRCFLYIPAH